MRRNGGNTRFVPIHADIGSEEGAARIISEVAHRDARLDSVVAALGQWQPGFVVDLDVATWQETLKNNLTSHWFAARTFLPHIVPGGSYTLLNGLSGETPFPGAGAMSIVAAARQMLKEALHWELMARGGQTRINNVVLGVVATRNRAESSPEWLTARDVGSILMEIARSSIRGATFRLPDKHALPAVLQRIKEAA